MLNYNLTRHVKKTSFMRPPIDRPYDRKLRLLVTNQCPHHCRYCHNEGMGGKGSLNMVPTDLEPHLGKLRGYCQRATISGGEPLCYTHLRELVDLLVIHDYDITLVTSISSIPQDDLILRDISSLHLSLHPSPNDRDAKTALSQITVDVKRICKAHPGLRVSVNLVHDSSGVGIQLFDSLVSLMRDTGCAVKYVSLFTPPEVGCATVGARWETRWAALLPLLNDRNYSPHSSTPRVVEYHGRDGTSLTLSDVGCMSQDDRFAHGHCFDSMDLVVKPDLQLQLCRWQRGGASLGDLFNKSSQSVADALACVMAEDTKNCPFGIQRHPLASQQDGMARFVFDQHYRWPDVPSKAGERVASLVRNGELSIAGANGVAARLEREFASFQGLPYALSTASGTLALYLAYHALGLGEGDEVIVPVYSYPGTVTPLVHLGARLRFCDVDPLTGNIDPVACLSVVGPHTKAVVVTHMWGCPAKIDSIVDICKKYNLRLVEDCSHAAGATYRGRKVGAFGDICCFSLQSNKTIFAGEGGILLTADKSLYECAVVTSSLRRRILDSVHGFVRRYWETGCALKAKIHPLGAAIALENLRCLNALNADRTRVAVKMSAALNGMDGISPPKDNDEASGRVYYTYKPTLSADVADYRDDIVERLITRGLRMARSDLRPLHRTVLFHELAREWNLNSAESHPRQYPGAEMYYRRILSLPLLCQVPQPLMDYYAQEVSDVVSKCASHAKREPLSVAISGV